MGTETLSDAERTAVRDRDGWQCTATIQPRTFTNAHGTVTIPREPRRCPIMGSEMVVLDGRTLCPKHAREVAGA